MDKVLEGVGANIDEFFLIDRNVVETIKINMLNITDPENKPKIERVNKEIYHYTNKMMESVLFNGQKVLEISYQELYGKGFRKKFYLN